MSDNGKDHAPFRKSDLLRLRCDALRYESVLVAPQWRSKHSEVGKAQILSRTALNI